MQLSSRQINKKTYRLPLFIFEASVAMLIAGCTSTPLQPPIATDQAAPAATSPKVARAPLPSLPPAGSGRGGYYQDDGPGDAPPDGLLDTPDAEPVIEPYSTRGNKPYVVFGKSYTPTLDEKPFRQRGIGSWYGKKFHGQKTSSGERYDMYKMTAAHPTLPIPSFVRVTNVKNGKQVIVRVNDRGPFHSNRIIDLSYTAALKLGYLSKGSGELEVERLLPDEIRRMVQARQDNVGTSVAIQEEATVMTGAISFPVIQSDAVVGLSPSPNAPAPVMSDAALTAGPTASAPLTSVRGDLPSKVSGGYFLQFGAYSGKANAQAARGRLLEQLSGVITVLDTVVVDGLHRLHAGPYASRAEAQDVAQRVQEKSALRALIVAR